MKTDSNICPACEARVDTARRTCPHCGDTLLHDSKGAVALWLLGEVPNHVIEPVARTITSSLGLPVVTQPARLSPRPSRRPDWNGASATAFLNQVHRRQRRGTVFSVGITSENIVPGAAWNYLFGYAYLGLPACVVSLHALSADHPRASHLVRRAAAIALHEIGHNCGLDHHGYDEGIACVMTADTELDCIERLDGGTHRFCRDCRAVVERVLQRRAR